MKSYILDMDGVLYRGNQLIPGAREFIERLQERGNPFLFLTNNSQRTPLDFQRKLERMGLNVSEERYFTSALATAAFLHSQKPGGSAFVIGEAGLTHALYQVGYSLTEVDPDYVVLGDTPSYDYAKIVQAVRLIMEGARFIATNPDVSGPEEEGIHPACGALAAPIERATGRQAYYIGKPNPLMMREALRRLDAHSEDAVMIGDRMDTDVLSGLGAGMHTVLVLTGITSRDAIAQYSYQPHEVVESLLDLKLD
ncbi:MAG TPA: HAD-IIA family hydrolase [Armatimonadota bacterium]|nr:HAD-IIA family hydrolase [Armatimonadota bacterium]